MSIVDQIEIVVGEPGLSTESVYARAAPEYDRFRELWLRLAGSEAEAELLRDLRSLLGPGMRVLDAGCGTGAISRIVRGMEPTVDLTMLDLTPAMLDQARDIPARHLIGNVMALPFEDDAFDVVVSAWVVETVPDPRKAVSEYLRVVAPDGFVLITFCSLPDGWLSRAGSSLLRKAVSRGFAGRFLEREKMPAHDCDRSRIMRFSGGLTTLAVLRKCCSVTDGVVPIPMTEIPETIF